MVDKIVLNLMKNEYTDRFSPKGISGDSELWQQRAQEELVYLLNRAGGEAVSYKNISSTEDTLKSSYHHAICISGNRGAGKTVFLRSAQNIWEGRLKDSKETDSPILYFTEVIDPTLLEIDDRFSDVIIATVYAAVEDKLKQANISLDKKNGFYQALKQLSESMGNSSDVNDLIGIDRILKYRSGIHIERYFHQFLAASVGLLECHAIVIPIDDVDMKIDNAFDVLDDIRRLLGCPLIIPLVSGDYDLYAHLTTMKFEDSLAKKNHSDNIMSYGVEKARFLSSAYLTKVFPNHSRLPLLPISELLPHLSIHYGGSNEDNMDYIAYEERIRDHFYSFCNGQERSSDWPKPENAREVTQLIRMLPPTQLVKYNLNENLYQSFKIWATDKQDGTAWCNAESYFQISRLTRGDYFSLSKIISFNSKLQVDEKYRWASKGFYDEQLHRMEELRSPSARNSEYKDMNRIIFDTVFSKKDKTLRSMPVLEYIKDPMYLSQKNVDSERENILISIFTHHDYYNNQLNRRYHVFFSRAFEILIWSLLSVTGNIPYLSESKEARFKSILCNVFKNPPFYSIFAVNPTKMIEDELVVDGSDSSDADLNMNSDAEKEIVKFTTAIYSWLNKYDSKLSEFKDKNLLPLISAIFNKVFSQLNILKMNIGKNPDKFSDERLSDLVKRFEYIFINSLVSFVRLGEVVNTNVATSAKTDTVRNINKFINSDKTLARNLSGLIDPLTKKSLNGLNERNLIVANLIEVVWQHPIFSLVSPNPQYVLGQERNDYNKGEGFKVLQVKVSSESIFDVGSLDELFNYYYKSSGKATIVTNEVVEWARNNKSTASNILKRLDELYHSDKLVKDKIDKSRGYAPRFYYGIDTVLNSEK